MAQAERVIVLVAHGTRDPRGIATVQTLAQRVRERLPECEIALAYVDVQAPALEDIVPEVLAHHRDALVVPIFLSRGYHTEVDIAGVAQAHPGRVQVTRPLGPHPLLAQTLSTRLDQAQVPPDAHIVLAAAGSSRAAGTEDVGEVVAQLSTLRAAPVRAAYAASAKPTVPQAVQEARDSGAPSVAVAAYLLAEGYFHDQLAAAGADFVTAPLGADDAVVDVIASRVAESQPG